MIDHNLPKDWEDLQNKVAEILTEVGNETEVDKKIKTVRGTVRVDVFSKDRSQSPNIVYLCECKHWEERIPKTTVHAFRTVVGDFGANFGIMISKKGFQKGAYEAAKNTNIRLVDWFGFQDMFEEKWLPAVSKRIYSECQAITDYTEPIITSFIAEELKRLQGKQKKIERFHELRRKYMPIGSIIVALRFGGDLLRPNGPKIPIQVELPSEKGITPKRVTIHSLREFMGYLSFWGKKGQNEFLKLFDQNA
jgi:hypothetical protein